MPSVDPYDQFKEELNAQPFIVIIGKYDHILGPRALFSSVPLKEEDFFRNLLRDALNTKNKFVNLDFNKFYSQVCKIEIEDLTARGHKQLYAIILLRHVEYPIIPILHFKRIEMLFLKLGNDKILLDKESTFRQFFNEVRDIYMRKDEVLPLESFHHEIRSGVNTIQGFCQLILEDFKKDKNFVETRLEEILNMILDSCDEIMKSIETHSQKSTDSL